MCDFYSKLIELDPKNTFCTILPQAYFLFSHLGQKQVCDTDDKAVMKLHNKIKISLPEIGTFFCCNFQTIVNLSLKFGGYNEKNMGLHL